jgi:hypothetical protein
MESLKDTWADTTTAHERLAAGETMADVERSHAVDAATISRLTAASPFERGGIGDLRRWRREG